MKGDVLYLEFFAFLSGAQRGQYHLPFGLEVSPTHWKWNHSMGHCMEWRHTSQHTYIIVHVTMMYIYTVIYIQS